jgi:hypothetical protein
MLRGEKERKTGKRLERNRERIENTEKRIHRIGEGQVAEGTKKIRVPVTEKQSTRDRTEGKINDCV